MSYRDDVDALEARAAALDAELAQVTKQRDATRSLLDEAKARAKLPVLDNIRVASPCDADWSQMTGDDRVRSCAACSKQVFNLSELTRAEAEALIVEKAGDLCARYYERKDGTILLADCTVGAAKRKRRVAIAGLALLAGGSAGVIAHQAQKPEQRECAGLQAIEQIEESSDPDVEIVAPVEDPPERRKPEIVIERKEIVHGFRPRMGKLITLHPEDMLGD